MKPKRNPMTLPRALFGMSFAWLTMIAPLTVLASWLAERPTGVWLLASLLAAPPAFAGLWWTIRHATLSIRWPVMQYLGWGAVLLPLVIVGSIATIWLAPQTVGIATLAAWLVLGVAGVVAATWIKEQSLRFEHHRLDRPYKLVHLSDIHIGSRSQRLLRRALEQAMQHDPDAIAITGDLLDSDYVRADELAALGQVDCPIYFAIGNHERYIDLERALAMVEAQGVRPLRSEAVTHGALQFIGIDDADHKDQVADHLPSIALSDSHFQILLYHRPDGWAAACHAGIDLMLAGHTHGGQIWPFYFVVKRHFRHVTGLFTEAGQHLYVSPGTGCWGPIMRLGTRAEMTVIDLHPITET